MTEQKGPRPAQPGRLIGQKIRVDIESGCWIWTAAMHRNGYGAVRWKGQLYKAHRFAFEMLRHPVPSGLDLDHLCRRRNCVNPFHLEPVTRSENLRRGFAARKAAA